MKKLITALFFSALLISCGNESSQNNKSKDETSSSSKITQKTYYKNAVGKSGKELKKALHEIISENHKKLTYKKAYNALETTDEDPKNKENLILFYTGRSEKKSRRSSKDPRQGWNREHVWPKSKGFKESASNFAYTDLHHLRPADSTVNSSKNDKNFDNGGKVHKEAKGSKADRDSWEPRDEIKGDVARMMFYMATRYEGDGGKYDDYDLELVNHTNTKGSKKDFDGRYGKLSTLLKWHKMDPVDKWEKARHEKVVKIQGNRNPFIDNPQWATKVFQN